MSNEVQLFNISTATAIKRNDKVVGTKYVLGTGPIADARKKLRAAGMKANEANKQIAEWLKGGNGNLVWAKTMSYLEAARAKGMFATTMELRENSFCLRGAKSPVAKAAKPEITKEMVGAMSAAEREAIMKLLLGEPEVKPAINV
jgi:hypothetical protein